MKNFESYFADYDKVIGHIPNCNLLKSKTVLITGATGMIGSAIADLLFRLNISHKFGVEIILCGRSKEAVDDRFGIHKWPYKYVFFDSTKEGLDLSEVESVDYIIHAASYGDPKSISDYPVDILMSNIYGTKALLDLVKIRNARLLYVSSGEIYGNDVAGKGIYFEDSYGYIDILKPRAVYPNVKRAAESLCISYSKQFGADIVIVRSCHVYGPTIKESDSRASAYFTRCAAQGKSIVMKSAGLQKRSYCYVLDTASAIITVMLNGVCNEAYNIANSESVASIRELADGLAKESGVEVIFENASDSELKSYNLMDNSILDSSKLEQLGWNGVFDLEAGLHNTLKYYEPL